MRQEELDIILEEHSKWLKDKSKGKRASLKEANLGEADLRECEGHPIEYWLENIEKIGKNHDYTEKEIKLYKAVLEALNEK